MKKALYFECNSGISGDMTVAALLDLGADEQILREAVDSLPLEGYQIKIGRRMKSAIDCADFDVVLDVENHDHDMEYLHGHTHTHDGEHADHHAHSHDGKHADHHTHTHGEGHVHHSRAHFHEGGHTHEEHTHSHEIGHVHAHVHRGLKEITEIIHAGQLTDNAKKIALNIFDIIAEAEAKAHGIPVEDVHFHEVGAVDSIIDIVSVAVCIDNLAPDKIIIPSLTEGSGTIRCQHGILPIPVPAVSNIAAAHGLNLRMSHVEGELITPTGAAIVAALCTDRELPEDMKIKGIGLGAGKREYNCPGFLRVMMLEYEETMDEDMIIKLESNIDDCSGEILGYTMELLLNAGARDVFYQPIYMKKNRPGYMLSVICKEENREQLESIIFRETTTIGIRRTTWKRSILERREGVVSTGYGDVKVKFCEYGNETYCYPEYDSVREVSNAQNVPFKTVYQAAVSADIERENGTWKR